MSTLKTYTVTFNCGREQVKPEVFARHLVKPLVSQNEIPDLLVLCLQEVAPIAHSFLGGSYLNPYFESLKHAVSLASARLDNATYVHIITRNVGMTAIMMFALEEEVEKVRWLEIAGVGVGVQEMGNKGAVGIRIGYLTPDDEVMELSVVAAHLTPMEDAFKRRNEDWKSIVQRLVFTPVDELGSAARQQRLSVEENIEDAPLLRDALGPKEIASGLFTPTSHLIFAGDLNYRTSAIKPSQYDVRKFPQPTDDSSKSHHYSKLLQNDQLHREVKAQRACHGLQEAPIDFPPTYKYSDRQRAMADTDDGATWLWANHRWPSWCDRILYLDLPPWVIEKGQLCSINVNSYTALPLMSTSDHRPVALSLSIPIKAIPAPINEIVDVRTHPPFSIDPRWRERRAVARNLEIVVGLAAYLGLTWEGNGILIAIFLGALGSWALVKSMVEI